MSHPEQPADNPSPEESDQEIVPGTAPATATPVPAAVVTPAQQPAMAQAMLGLNIWQGQFPPPDAVERYEQVLGGAFNRIISMAEKQQQATIDAAADVRKKQYYETRRGQILGSAVTFFATACALACAYWRHDWVAGAFIGVPLLSVATALILGRRQQGNGQQTGQTSPLLVAPSAPAQQQTQLRAQQKAHLPFDRPEAPSTGTDGRSRKGDTSI